MSPWKRQRPTHLQAARPHRHRALRPSAAALTVLLLAGAAGAAGDPAREPEGEVVISAAASLTTAFRALADAFEKAHPGVVVRTNFAGSQSLVQQILEGAPVDVFASADEANMRRLAGAGGVAGTPRTFARNRLAVAVAEGNPKGIAGLADLERPGLVVALGAPGVPAGRYAREAFARAGLPVPEASQELDVKAALARVAMGEADAAVVYVTDVRAASDRVDGVAIPEAVNPIASYPIAVVAGAPNASAAADFVAFVAGPTGSATLARFGFLPP